MPLPARDKPGTATRWTTRVRLFLYGAFVENITLKLISLALAVLVWNYVAGARSVRMDVSVDLVYKLPADKILESEPPASVLVSVEGPATAMGLWRTHDLRMPVDVGEAAEGPVSVYLDESAIPRPASVRVVRITPSQLMLRFVRKTNWLVRVAPNVAGTPPRGLLLGSVRVTPEIVRVEGAATEERTLGEVLTLPVLLDNRAGSFDVEVPLQRGSPTIVSISPDRVRVAVELRVDRAERTLTLPVVVEDAPEGWRVDPPRVAVTVAGLSADVNRLSEDQVRVYAPGPEGDEAVTVPVLHRLADGELELEVTLNPTEVRLVPPPPRPRGGRRP